MAPWVTRDPQRARWIRKATVKLSITDPDSGSIIDAFEPACIALQSMVCVKHLSVWVEDRYEDMATHMSSHIFPFLLETFQTNLYPEDNLGGFLAAHPEIQSYQQFPRRTHTARELPSHILPRVTSVIHPPIGILGMIRGRPVQTIETDLRLPEDVDQLFEAIAVSAADVLNLRLVSAPV